MFWEVTVLLWAFIFLIYGYNFCLAAFGIRKFRPIRRHKPKHKFACLIPAHNEGTVISGVIDDLKHQKYPSDLVDVFVLADNCIDDTYEKAKNSTVFVFQRRSLERRRGKTYALQFLFKKVFNDYHDKAYDAICIFDADNRVDSKFLARMNDALCEGQECIQGYLGTKNPYDSWVTKAIYGSYLVTNRLWQLSKTRLGLSSACGGTGLCVSSGLIRKYRWKAQTLAEDLEFEIFLSLEGVKVKWLHDAIVYDEKPAALKVALKQRIRWLKGHLQNLQLYLPKLVIQIIKKRDLVLLDQAFYLLTCVFGGIVGMVTLFQGLSFFLPIDLFHIPALFSLCANLLILTYPVLGILLETKNVRNLTLVIYMAAFAWIWPAALFGAILTYHDKTWIHTPHGDKIKV
jgi:cellulose synthase/poly-beta-1,6-N-acetylglucosamine synthase-like glycosyltransferase